jgi:hypothetical protein
MKIKAKTKAGFIGWMVLAIAVVLIIVFLVIPKTTPIEPAKITGLPAEVTTTMVNAAWKQGAFILDVREQDE